MTDRIKSAQEVYFLVRVGQMTEEDLSMWLQQNIDAHMADEEQFIIDQYGHEWADDEDY